MTATKGVARSAGESQVVAAAAVAGGAGPERAAAWRGARGGPRRRRGGRKGGRGEGPRARRSRRRRRPERRRYRVVSELRSLEKALSKNDFDGAEGSRSEEMLKPLRPLRLKSIDELDLNTRGKLITTLLRVRAAAEAGRMEAAAASRGSPAPRRLRPKLRPPRGAAAAEAAAPAEAAPAEAAASRLEETRPPRRPRRGRR